MLLRVHPFVAGGVVRFARATCQLRHVRREDIAVYGRFRREFVTDLFSLIKKHERAVGEASGVQGFAGRAERMAPSAQDSALKDGGLFVVRSDRKVRFSLVCGR